MTTRSDSGNADVSAVNTGCVFYFGQRKVKQWSEGRGRENVTLKKTTTAHPVLSF